MGKPKRRGPGLTPPKDQIQLKKAMDPFANQRNEQLALQLLQRGQLEDAEAIYRKQIAAGHANHLTYGRLAAICGMTGRLGELIAWLQFAIKLEPCYADAYYNLGIAHEKSDNLDAAIDCFKRALAIDPNQPEAHLQLAYTLKKQGDLQAAISAYKSAIGIRPNSLEALVNLGVALGELGNINDAISSFKKALDLAPHQPDISYNLGLAHASNGDFKASVTALNYTIKLNPLHAQAHNSLGASYQKTGDLDNAISAYSKAIRLAPNYAEAHYNLGIAFVEKGLLDAAISAYKSAIELKPNYPDAYNNLGLALQEKDELYAAIDSYMQAIQLNPLHAEAHNSLGTARLKQGDLDGAISSHQRAINLKPDYPEAHYNLAAAFLEHGDLEAAIAAYKTAIRIKPENPEFHNGLGNAFQLKGRASEAIKSYTQATSLNPDFTEAHWNMSGPLLSIGNYELGLEKYENRLRLKSQVLNIDSLPICPRWDGRPLARGERLLIISEQGLGDMLHFMRYVRHIRDRGINATLSAQTKLHALIKTSAIVAEPICQEKAKTITSGQWTPLISLLKHLNVSPENPIISEPYISTTSQLKEKWRKILAAESKPIIGINWQGNPDIEKSLLKGRSLSLEAFGPIAKYTNTSLLSLQKGAGSEQLSSCSFKDRFVQCQAQVDATWDFLETAAIILNCDLIITCDTSVAHLAGGLGQRTWLLLHKVPEWRWGIKGDTTFWYPSVKLFRQNVMNNWSEVMQDVAAVLQDLLPSIQQH